jgi:L-asparagine transporter-like permease
MQLIYILLILSVALAIIKVAIIALLIVFGIGLLVATVKHPAAAIGFMLMMVTVSLVEAHPWAAGAGLIAMAIAAIASKSS